MQNTSDFSILVVDDEDIMRSCLRDVLSDGGYRVEVAASGEEGVGLVEGTFYDLVILDIRMPGISGVEVLKVIKRIRPASEVVMITGYASVSAAAESMKYGAFEYLTKPFEMNQIKEVIRLALEKRKPRTSEDSLRISKTF